MKRKRLTAIGIVLLLAVAALVVELIWGLSLTRGIDNCPVKEVYLMANPGEEPYLSIDIPPGSVPFSKLRVSVEGITLAVDPAIPGEMAISSGDPFIWGNRWPWIKHITLTVKTDGQRKGFQALFSPGRIKSLRRDFKKGLVLGITSYGLLTSGGRLLEE